MVLTCQHFEQCNAHGIIPGYKAARGDNVHRHQRMHNLPECAFNLAIHTRWNNGTNDTYNSETPMCLMCWRQTIHHILTQSEHLGKTHSNMYYRRGKDIGIEHSPLYIAHGTGAINIHIKTMLGSTIGTWEVNNSSEHYGRTTQLLYGGQPLHNGASPAAHEHLLGDHTAQCNEHGSRMPTM
eukprot:4758708-Amphidinium_carterae.1